MSKSYLVSDNTGNGLKWGNEARSLGDAHECRY